MVYRSVWHSSEPRSIDRPTYRNAGSDSVSISRIPSRRNRGNVSDYRETQRNAARYEEHLHIVA